MRKRIKAHLHFADGSTFPGFTNKDLSGEVWGEASFITSMTGYQESITDPSFLGQHIIFTTSHVGNYPPDERAMQSKKAHAASLIARHFTPNSFLDNLDIPLFWGLDVRSLTRYLSQKNSASHKAVLLLDERTPAPAVFEKKSLVCNQLEAGEHRKASGFKGGEKSHRADRLRLQRCD